MPVLHIEHEISDLQLWLQAFANYASAREKAGVQSAAVFHPEHDQNFIIVDLTFATVEAATAYRAFLQQNVWTSASASAALAGQPRAVILTEVNTG